MSGTPLVDRGKDEIFAGLPGGGYGGGGFARGFASGGLAAGGGLGAGGAVSSFSAPAGIGGGLGPGVTSRSFGSVGIAPGVAGRRFEGRGLEGRRFAGRGFERHFRGRRFFGPLYGYGPYYDNECYVWTPYGYQWVCGPDYGYGY